MIELLVVWTPASVASALLGGMGMGFFLVARFSNPRYNAIQTIGVLLTIGWFAGLVFWSGQAVEALSSDGIIFMWRVLSRAGLFGLFIAMMALSTGYAVSRERGGWRR